MGLSNYQNYSLTTHFKQRALERFGIQEKDCLKWFRVQAQSLKLHPSQKNDDPHQKHFISSDRIIIICNTENHTARTCYPVGAENKNLYVQFKEERENLVNSYRTKLIHQEADSISQSLESILKMTKEAKNSVVSKTWMDNYDASIRQLHSRLEKLQQQLNLFN